MRHDPQLVISSRVLAISRSAPLQVRSQLGDLLVRVLACVWTQGPGTTDLDVQTLVRTVTPISGSGSDTPLYVSCPVWHSIPSRSSLHQRAMASDNNSTPVNRAANTMRYGNRASAAPTASERRSQSVLALARLAHYRELLSRPRTIITRRRVRPRHTKRKDCQALLRNGGAKEHREHKVNQP